MRNLAILLSSGVAIATPAVAQTNSTGTTASENSAPVPPAAQAPGAGAGDIIVTAQRRSEKLERTPVAVQVLSGETLSTQAITSERDLQIAAPGLTVKASQNENQLNYSLRGQTVDTFTSSLPAVLPYVNEVQVGGIGQSAFYDLQSLQVVKGPQGTLFGRNATGGAVLFTTAKPTAETSGYVVARYGTFKDKQLEGAVGGTLVPDVLRARVAGVYRKRDGYQRNLFYGTKLGGFEREGARLSLAFTPTTKLTNELVTEYFHDNGTSIAASVYYAVPPSANVGGYPIVQNNVFFNNPSLGELADAQKARGPFVVDVDSLTDHRLTKWIVSNVTSYKLGDDTTLKNVFGFVNTKFLDVGDLDGTRLGIDGRGTAATGPKGGIGTIKQFSEELQLLGKAFDSHLEYVVGVYAASIKDHTRNTSYILAEFGLPPQTNAGTTTSRSIAGYSQATLDTGLAGFKLTGGLRYTIEEVKFERDSDDLYNQPKFANLYTTGQFIAGQKDTFKKLSWTVGLQNQVTRDVMLYANSRRSFRSGGFNFHAPPTPGFADEAGGEFRPEIATDIEFGAKYRGRLGDVPASLNVALYKMWVKDVQRAFYAAVTGGLAGLTVNVPQAQVKGFEIDGSIKPTRWLSLGGNLNYTDAKFTKNRVPVLGTSSGTLIALFDTYPDTPKWSGLAFADVTVPVSSTYHVALHGDVFSQTSNYISSTGKSLNPGTKVDGYSVANFRVALEPESRKGWSIAGLVKNAFNKTYYTGGIGFASLFALNIVVPGEPRTYLAEVRYKF